MAGNTHHRDLCGNDWQRLAFNAKDAFAIWLYDVELGNITDPVRAGHIAVARRFRDALAATTVSWLPPPGIELNIMLPGSWQIWIEIVPGYRCRSEQRQPPVGFDGDAMRTALRQLETPGPPDQRRPLPLPVPAALPRTGRCRAPAALRLLLPGRSRSSRCPSGQRPHRGAADSHGHPVRTFPASPARHRHRRVPRWRLRAARRTTGPAHRRAEPHPHHRPPGRES